jgi:hypothetical protein
MRPIKMVGWSGEREYKYRQNGNRLKKNKRENVEVKVIL